MIISTNLDTTRKIDAALIRKGRAYKILHFRELTCDEANRARESIGLEPIEFDTSIQSMTLSTALNYTTVEDINSRKKNAIGFRG